MARERVVVFWLRMSNAARYRHLHTGSSVVLLLSLLIVVSCTPSLADDSLRERIASAQIHQTLNTEGSVVKSVVASSGNVAVRLVRNGTTIAAVYDADGSQIFARSVLNSDHPRIAGLTLSADGQTLIVSEERERPWNWKQVVYGIDGEVRFEVLSDAHLIPSASGRYFGVSYNDIVEPPFAVYDSSGVELPFSIPGLYEWRCRFVGDETFVVASRDSVWFADIARSVVTASHPLGKEIFESPPIIKTSKEGGIVAIYNYDCLMVFSSSGQLLWSDNFGDCLGGVTIDDKGEWLALQFYHRGQHDGHVAIVPVESPQERTVSGTIPELNNCIFRNDEVSWFQDGLVTFLLPMTAELFSLYDDLDYRTLMLSFDRESRLLGEPVTISGLLQPVRSPARAASRFVHYQSNDVLTITDLSDVNDQQ